MRTLSRSSSGCQKTFADTSNCVNGHPISPGLADGIATILDAPKAQIKSVKTDDVSTEIIRLKRALQSAKDDLRALENRMHSEFGGTEAEIFATHISILEDPGLFEDIAKRIETNRIRVESAINQSVTEFARRLSQADDPYLKEREQDIRDIGQRLMRHASGRSSARFLSLDDNTIIVAGELMPSDIVELDFNNLKGIVLERCGETGHVAILARSLGIPIISGITKPAIHIHQGQHLLLNGASGELILSPDACQLAIFRKALAQFEATSKLEREQTKLPCKTVDGTSIAILANLGRPSETELSACAGLSGVGLLRTEFLFLDHVDPPSLEQQIYLYRWVAHKMQGNQVVIRTLDLGGDKFPLFLERELEHNPDLGVRGLRFSLNAGIELFRQQIKAILLAGKDYPLAIMLPMVLGFDDLILAKEVIQQAAEQSNVDELPPTGVLVETPSSVMMIDDIVGQCDFVGIGTNDLTQFILAADRNSQDTLEDYSVLHPSVLRSVQRVIQAADQAGKPVTICGEAASDPQIASIFVGMGLRRLSMSPMASAKVKYFLRSHKIETLNQAANLALSANTISGVRDAIKILENKPSHWY